MFEKQVCYTGKQCGIFVVTAPAINTNGYGASEEVAWEDFKHQVHDLIQDIPKFSEKFLKLAINRPFDEEDVLAGFDYPDQVKKSVVEF